MNVVIRTAMIPIKIYVTREARKKIDDIAQRHGLKVPEVTRALIDRGIEWEERVNGHIKRMDSDQDPDCL